MPINQTCLQSIIPNYPVMVDNNNEQSSGNEIYSIAPGENKHLFSAKSCLMSFVLPSHAFKLKSVLESTDFP